MDGKMKDKQCFKKKAIAGKADRHVRDEKSAQDAAIDYKFASKTFHQLRSCKYVKVNLH